MDAEDIVFVAVQSERYTPLDQISERKIFFIAMIIIILIFNF
jgi:hypothetical protein